LIKSELNQSLINLSPQHDANRENGFQGSCQYNEQAAMDSW